MAKARWVSPWDRVCSWVSLYLTSVCLHLWLGASGAHASMLGSTFCFAPWLLATCFLHSAHSVSHFTLLKAERSIHLVQTLLTRLGWRGPSLGSAMAFWGWVAHMGQDGYIHLYLLSGWVSLSELANVLTDFSTLNSLSEHLPLSLTVQSPPESPQNLQTHLTYSTWKSFL